jgi:hypothetical protein
MSVLTKTIEHSAPQERTNDESDADLANRTIANDDT